MLTGLLTKLILAIVFGATIGLERESGKKTTSGEVGGIRTYALIALIGALVGMFFTNSFSALALLIAGAFLVLLITYYAVSSPVTKNFGLTSELSVVITFLIAASKTQPQEATHEHQRIQRKIYLPAHR